MAGLIAIDVNEPTPIYVQIERGLRAAIATGRLPIGGQLPTVRQLAVDLRINANTVARVYAELERAGIVETRRGVGTFVSSAKPMTAPRRGREPELRALVQRWLEEAASRGFTAEDLERQLRELAAD
jgi:GntR family transcriptional regulator